MKACQDQVRNYSYSSQTGTTFFGSPSKTVLVFDKVSSKWLNPRDGSEVNDRSPDFFISPGWDDAYRYVAQSVAEKLTVKLNH